MHDVTTLSPTGCPQAGDPALAERLRALSHPARLAVLRQLAKAEQCLCGEIVRGLPLAQSTVSQHIKILVEAGLVRSESKGQRTCYVLDRVALAALEADVQAMFLALGAAQAACWTDDPADAACS
ncbi:transcriptional regulator [Azorhizobium oxalatiphilum]|uniref:Transcriptional regulator n=1 Tax=Azorhizobium oxalatiphilum TaxID=980631 RepID=A0A917C8D9_9HYPH|nr:metalloregulator ArsR/SmtB family transcription factor [Azorhizobium oxalatiphilum]GGF72757.1 transcriptional regulator [Azorhizobium oxalatiphilum]